MHKDLLKTNKNVANIQDLTFIQLCIFTCIYKCGSNFKSIQWNTSYQYCAIGIWRVLCQMSPN